MSPRHVWLIVFGGFLALAGEMIKGDHHQLITLATGIVTGAYGHAMSARRRRGMRPRGTTADRRPPAAAREK